MMSKTAQSRLRPRIRSRRIVLCLGILIGILIMSSVEAIGQLTTGTITGTVTDQTGAAVPGATVTLKHTDTGISRTAQTRENGKYEALSLPTGGYEISASLSGFRTVVHTGIVLAVGQNAVVDFALQVGEVNQSQSRVRPLKSKPQPQPFQTLLMKKKSQTFRSTDAI